MIDKKWPNFKKAFSDFSIEKVAEFDEKDVERLLSDASIVRNRLKILAAINNARIFQDLRREYGSFQGYLDSLDKTDNYAFVIKELGKRFNRIGPSSARIFLYTVGEDIKRPME